MFLYNMHYIAMEMPPFSDCCEANPTVKNYNLLIFMITYIIYVNL